MFRVGGDAATKIAAYASMSGTRVAVEDLATTLGPFIWDICFDKGDPLRSASIGTGREIMGVLPGSRFSLPEAFMSPPSEDDRLAFVKKLKNSATIRRAAKNLISEGKHPEKSEQEVVEMLCHDLLAHTGLNLSEARSDATSNQT
jgi:hypothetical protein